MGQSNEPGAVGWATTATAPDIVVPPAGNQSTGFAALDTPPYAWVNWAWNRFGAWVNYLASFVTSTSDAFVLSGMTTAEVGVPNATQVNVAVGLALVDGSEVEVTGTETITLPAAGTGSGGSISYHVIYIDSAGAIGVDTTTGSTDDFDEFEFFARAAYQADRSKCELAIVQDIGQATYTNAYIRDLRQTKPVSTGVIESGSVDAGDLRAAVVYPRFGTQTQSDPIRRDVAFKLVGYDFPDLLGGIIPSNFRPGNVRCTFKLVEAKALDTAGPDGLSFFSVAPWSGDVGSAVVGIALHDGTSIVAPSGGWAGGLDGGMNYWQGDLDPTKAHTIQLHLKTSQSLTDYVLHVETEHGVTNAVDVQTPAT